MNLEDWIEQTWAQSPPRAARQEDTGFSEVKIEPCDFERLLERAMEILNARAQSSSSSTRAQKSDASRI
jgi:hypothetical protein